MQPRDAGLEDAELTRFWQIMGATTLMLTVLLAWLWEEFNALAP